jgi:hypothetical protein
MVERVESGQRQELVVLFEFECRDTGDDIVIRKRAERHFLLLPYTRITSEDFEAAKRRDDE